MLTFPIPVFASAVLVFLLVRGLFRRDLPLSLQMLLLMCAVQNAVVALVHFYGLDSLQPLHPLIASCIPALAWVAFQIEAMEKTRWQHLAVHLAAPIVVAGCILVVPRLLDALLVFEFMVYGAAIFMAVRKSDGILPAAQMGAGPIPARLWQTIAIVLLAMASIDATVSLMLAFGHSWLHLWILSAASSCLLLTIGLLGTTPELAGLHSPAPQPQAPDVDVDVDASTLKEDSDITARLEHILLEEQLYLDPDLTLIRLARKLGLPGKQLSASVNRHAKTNISRFINQLRIEQACRLLESGETITEAMFKSGFNTKSNFNREFLRITGKTPSKWNRHDGEIEQ